MEIVLIIGRFCCEQIKTSAFFALNFDVFRIFRKFHNILGVGVELHTNFSLNLNISNLT